MHHKVKKLIWNILLSLAVVSLFINNFNQITIAQDLEDGPRDFPELLINNKKSENPKIQSNLLLLVSNDTLNRNFNTSNSNNYGMIDNIIQVEVSLKDEQSISLLRAFSNEIIIENQYKSLAQILIPIDLLVDLSEEDYVTFIRKPVEPRLHEVTSEGVDIIGADTVYDEGYNGADVKVAIIDLGFEGYATNPNLPSERVLYTLSMY